MDFHSIKIIALIMFIQYSVYTQIKYNIYTRQTVIILLLAESNISSKNKTIVDKYIIIIIIEVRSIVTTPHEQYVAPSIVHTLSPHSVACIYRWTTMISCKLHLENKLKTHLLSTYKLFLHKTSESRLLDYFKNNF